MVVRLADSREETVCPIGVDTPETKHPQKGIECYGTEASAFMAGLLPAGTAVRLERDTDPRDHY